VPPVGQPLTLVDITTRPLEDSEAAHVAELPLAVVDLCLEFALYSLASLRLNRDLSLKEPLTVVLAVLPLTGISSKTLVKDQVTKSVSFSLLKVAKVNLLDRLVPLVSKHGDKAAATRLAIQFLTVVDRPIRKSFNKFCIFDAELLNPFDRLDVCLLTDY